MGYHTMSFRRIIKLNPTKVREIRRMHASGDYSQVDIAMKFNVTPTAIHYIIRGKTWVGVK